MTEEPTRQPTPLDEQQLNFPHPGVGLEPAPSMTPSPWPHVLTAGAIWFASVLVLVFLPLFVALPYMIYKLTAGGTVSAEALMKDPTLIFLSVLAILPVHVITFAIGWFYVTGNGKYPFWKTIGFEWPKNLTPASGLMLSILIAVALYTIAAVVTSLWGGAKTDIDLLIESSLPARIVVAFAAVATAPLVEELIYRGIVYTALERATGKVISVIAVSLLFAGVHVVQYWNNLAVIVMITVLSFTLSTVRAVTGKLLPPFLIHLVFNGVQSILMVLSIFIDNEYLKP